MFIIFFFFNDTATTEIYTLSLHDALPILGIGKLTPVLRRQQQRGQVDRHRLQDRRAASDVDRLAHARSEEHTSELQSRQYLVCRLLLEKKKKNNQDHEPRPSSVRRTARDV